MAMGNFARIVVIYYLVNLQMQIYQIIRINKNYLSTFFISPGKELFKAA